jgi:hypothetical protein
MTNTALRHDGYAGIAPDELERIRQELSISLGLTPVDDSPGRDLIRHHLRIVRAELDRRDGETRG